MTVHTSSAYEKELSELREKVIDMGAHCEELIDMALRAMTERDIGLAIRVESADREIDRSEMAIDELAVRILARRQPAARDLRFLVFALKVVTDLERIGDEAANMAERAAQLSEQGFPVRSLQARIQQMTEVAKAMVHDALSAFVQGDEKLARAVCARDDEVDAMYGEITRASLEYIAKHPDRVSASMCIASTAKYLERIADHATNIGEMVVFMTSGVDVRHPFKR